MTPNIGLGGNSGMESVVVLTNLLHKAVNSSPNGKPDYNTLQSVLTEYQAERQIRMRQFIDFSGLATKLQAWETIWYKIMSRVIPFLPDNTFAKQCTALFVKAPKLDFVPVPGNIKGTVPWDDEVAELKTQEKPKPLLGKGVQNLLNWGTTPLLSLGVLLSFFFMVQGARALAAATN